ncbi:MAG: transposase, partial [Eubacteriaceae bacterium]
QLSVTAHYHIIMRDNNNAYIFKEYRDKKYFLKVLKEVETEGIIQIAASCIMDNHAHLLMKIIRYVHINPVKANNYSYNNTRL